MQTARGIVKLGMEIEVADWKRGESYHTAVADLLASNLMWDDGNRWEEYHPYHCNCDVGGCRDVRSGNPIYMTPIVVATYDASLPNTGAEFITSTTILTDDGLQMLKPIWDIVAGKAVWNNKIRSRNGGASSPSIHLHVSATKPGTTVTVEQTAPITEMVRSADCVHALSLFAPELLAVASSAGVKRGLQFRQPLRFAQDTDHHLFIQVRKFKPGQLVYFEWRMFEAVYDDWDYVEACGFLAAALTRGFLKEDFFPRLMQVGYTWPYSTSRASELVAADDTEGILKLVDRERLRVLQDVCLAELDDDDRGRTLLAQLFDKTFASI